jgi:hypothetical protein
MPSRLPNLNRLAVEIRAAQVRPGRTAGDALSYVVRHRRSLAAFDGHIDLAVQAGEPDADGTVRGLAHHLEALTDIVCRELWSREIYLGGAVIAELLFDATRDPQVPDPLRAVLDFLRDRRVARPGLLVFPLHGFGVLSAGLLHGLTEQRLTVVNERAGYVLIPQTNRVAGTVDALERARLDLGVAKSVPAETIRHYHRSRAGWLTSNPLLVVRVTHLAGSMYENQPLLMRRVRAVTGLLAMLAAFQPRAADRAAHYFSTTTTNNSETLDIHHYVALASHPNVHQHLDGDCVPINVAREQVYELSDLGVQLDPSYRSRRATLFERVEVSVERVHRSAAHADIRGLRGAQAGVARKLFLSMDYFRRSYRRATSPWATSITLATALEMMLTDGWEGLGVAERIQERARVLLTGTRGTSGYQAALGHLYEVRSQFVHHGRSDGVYNLDQVRQAYVLLFCRLAEALDGITANTNHPMRDICGI